MAGEKRTTPERISAQFSGVDEEYIREDIVGRIVSERVLAAYEDAKSACISKRDANPISEGAYDNAAFAVASRIPAESRDALDRLIAEAVADEREECALVADMLAAEIMAEHSSFGADGIEAAFHISASIRSRAQRR